jgi:hypothetical protein
LQISNDNLSSNPLGLGKFYEIILFVEMLNSLQKIRRKDQIKPLVKFEEHNVVKENRFFFGIAKNLQNRRNK